MSSSYKYIKKETEHKTIINIDNGISIGKSDETLFISGPCSIESLEQIETVAQTLVRNNIKILRAGCFKPRTSPYSFMGLGEKGLELLSYIRKKYGLKIITEVRDSTQVDIVLEHADIIQIGSKAMWDYGIHKACGNSDKPILLKRHFGASLKEFCQISEFIMVHGNENIILCERGVRGFNKETRFLLDVCGVEWLKKHTHLPILLDPSHAMGHRYAVKNLTLACCALGVDGIMIESHPNPPKAKSDSAQQVDLDALTDIVDASRVVLQSIGKRLV
jgi:3-deoxy-7-phosphoheptulonate synthase